MTTTTRIPTIISYQMSLSLASFYKYLNGSLFFLSLIATLLPLASPYSNVTLSSLGGNLEVMVYLPHAVKPSEATYYMASRFDHGSMIGSITSKNEKTGAKHLLFGSKNWRQPHNSGWPESGIGLASEFGVGDDGPLCQYRCGWDGVNDVTNGVLGYEDAKNGEPFLKIGVGALIKGSCPSCDSTDNYRFNSPYEFAELPQWKVFTSSSSIVSMEHEARVRNYGYRLHKDIVLDGNVLAVTSVLTNLGDTAFSTAWYSHNFFTCDGIPVRDGYSLDMDIQGDKGKLYEEPGVIGSWAVPLRTFANIREFKDHVTVDVARPLNGDTRIKAEFVKDDASKGAFTLHGCTTSLRSELPDVINNRIPMYAYNLYLEKGTFSPEPQILLHLQPGQSTSWTQRLVIENEDEGIKGLPLLGKSVARTDDGSENVWKLIAAAVIMVGAVLSLHVRQRVSARDNDNGRRREDYSTVPDVA
ncbi:expressed unknown protein [Seminavis robusta]|uniref:Uncharacterized protein n=1 Tax=Seminavis robusta TaxID=568900 RepID=A0A9N8HW78_9STRA|nr:expressed unknown protein [Seminavis robusta]|eukprot:Sro1929_g306100.1 n/a (471) ;mRNA; r:14731-16143